MVAKQTLNAKKKHSSKILIKPDSKLELKWPILIIDDVFAWNVEGVLEKPKEKPGEKNG